MSFISFLSEPGSRTWVIRQNGQILVTAFSTSELYQVDPTHPLNSHTVIHRIPGAGSLGIVEMQQDMFYVIAGNWSTFIFNTASGSYWYGKSTQQIFSCIPTNNADGIPAGPTEVIATNIFGDDIASILQGTPTLARAWMIL